MQPAQQLPAPTITSDRSHGRLTPATLAHRRRYMTLPPIRPGAAERLTADFLAVRGVTACPTRYVLPVEQRPQPARGGY
jgi:hypothetical protein